jgi:hypothetical protein
MDIVSIGKYIMMQPKQFFKFCLKIIFIKNVKQLKECRLGIIVNPPPPPQLLSTTLYMGALKINNY